MLKWLGEVTAESVRKGHPDKFCDQVSDAVLDECLRQDSGSRVAVETMASGKLVIVGGEITTGGWVDFREVVYGVASDVGYDDDLSVVNIVQQQSPDIAQGVDIGGAGDQGIMVGYAVDQTPELMPLPVMLSHRVMMEVDAAEHSGILADGKCQFTLDSGSHPDKVINAVVSLQHRDDVDTVDVARFVAPIVEGVLDEYELAWNGRLFVNPTGSFVVGGPEGDTGVTGRKTQVDAYGPWPPHGGGAFSGKDPTKVDRSAAYAARHIAKNVVYNLPEVDECVVYVAYGIGLAKPLSLEIYDQNGDICPGGLEIAEALYGSPPLQPEAIIDVLGLSEPIYTPTAYYGHFGWPRVNSSIMFPWEKKEEV
jgi:S-adenosylmethionine synthetase